MKKQGVTITVHMVASVDGIIARPDNSISWFETGHLFEDGEEAEDPTAFLKSIDCYVMGSKTYELAMELSKEYGWAYGDKTTIVLSHRKFEDDRPHIVFWEGDIQNLVKDHLSAKYKSVWVVGGAEVVNSLLQLKLVDEIRIGLLPILLGDGLRYFDFLPEENKLKLLKAKAYKNGMIDLHYAVNH